MTSPFLAKAVIEIKKVFHDVDISNWSEQRKILCFHVITLSRNRGYDNTEIRKADPTPIKPGIDIDDIDLSSLSTDDKVELLGKGLCALCGHLPVEPARCQECGCSYCRMCGIYMLRLAGTRLAQDMVCFLAVNISINCLYTDQYTSRHVDTLFLDETGLFTQLTVPCNRLNCGFEGKFYETMIHMKQCPIAHYKLNVRLLTSFFDVEHSSALLIRMAKAYVEQTRVYKINQPFEEITTSVWTPDPRFPDDEIPWGMIPPAAGDNVSAEPIPSTSTDNSPKDQEFRVLMKLNRIARGHLPPDCLSFTVPCRHMPKKNTTFSVEPEPCGMMEVDGEEFSNVKASQFFGDRANPLRRSAEFWREEFRKAQQIEDPIARRNRIGSLKRRATAKGKSRKYESDIARRKSLYAQQLVKFNPPLTLNEKHPNYKLIMNNIDICFKSNKTFVAMDLEGQTLKINGILYGVPGSVGIAAMKSSVVLHEIIRWPKELLADPDRKNRLTGLSWEACQHGNTLAYVRKQVADVLSSADIIVLHGQSSDIKHLYFTSDDYEKWRHKIRDVGAYYNIRKREGGSMAVQLATYLLMGCCIQGMKYHYAIQDAFYTLMLYYADMDAIEECYEQCKYDVYDNNGWTEVRYPQNRQMSALYQRYQERWREWPHAIKFRKLGKPRKLQEEDEDAFIEPDESRRPPYNVGVDGYSCFYRR